jgi:N-acyl-D-amino-acid deacylase
MRRSLLTLAAALIACSPGTPPPATGPTPTRFPTPTVDFGDYDLIIANGRLVDGSGAAWFYGDVAIRGDRIAQVAPRGVLSRTRTKHWLDAAGMVVAPGFIDIQGQSDFTFTLGDGRGISKITQGITTEIMGEGSSPAPTNANYKGFDRPGAAYPGPRGFAGWLAAMQANGVSENFGSFLGAATVRVYAKGEAQGPATPAELDTMRAVVRNAMQDGAFGVASALIYPPGNYASTEELIELARAMAPFGGLYITHMRSEGNAWLEAIDEAIRIGREGGVPVEIYHLKAGGKRNWAKTPAAIAKIDSARAAGLDVQANMYAYTAGGTGLTACLPPWASADGKLFDNIANAETRRRIRADMDRDQNEWESLCQMGGPENVLFAQFETPENKRFVGKRLSEVAQMTGKEWQEAAMDLIASERSRVETIYFLMSEENVKIKLRQPWMKFGTDADAQDPATAQGLTHPRAYGNYPRILGKYVRDERVLPLEDAIRKMTSAVATRLSIADRGLLRPGFFADVVIFDPETVADRATFEQPHQVSVGIKHVLVNGVMVLQDGIHTGAKPGRMVRGPGWIASP